MYEVFEIIITSSLDSSSLSSNSSSTSRRRRRSLITTAAAVAAAILISPAGASDPCPMQGGTGWMASSDCTQYYYCQNGVNLAGTFYSCETNQLFSLTETLCKDKAAVDCDPSYYEDAVTAADSSNETDAVVTYINITSAAFGASISPKPTNAPIQPKGPDIPRPKYFSDSAISSCASTLEQEPPTWISVLYDSKSICCQENYSWNPNCLGADFHEITYSPSSTPSKSASPTIKPSMFPSEMRSESPSNVPSDSPTMEPSLFPSTVPSKEASTAPSFAPTDVGGSSTRGTAQFNPVYGYNMGGRPARPVDESSSSTSSSLMSELILQASDGAAISQQRSNVNFHPNAALAVDAGYEGNNEKLDSLLKFDLSLLDTFQDIESVTLQLYSMGNCEGSNIYTTSMSTWDQSTVTWETAPSEVVDHVGTLGIVVTQEWYDVDITSALTANTQYTIGSGSEKHITLRIDSDMNGRCMYGASDGTGDNGAKLVVKYKTEKSTSSSSSGMIMQSGEPIRVFSKAGDIAILRATDDATLDLNNGMGQYGLTNTLNVAFDLETRDVLDFVVRFDLSQVLLPPTKALFTLFAELDCPNSGNIYIVAYDGTNDWTEEEVSYETAPEITIADERDLVTDIGSFGSVTAGKWYARDVVDALKDAIRANKPSLTFRVTTSANASPCQYSSIQSGRAPKLLIEF